MRKLIVYMTLLLILFIGIQVNQAHAATRVWVGAIGATGSDWNTPANWLGGVVPLTGDAVTIGLTQILIASPTFPSGSTISLSSITFGALLPSVFGPITLTVNGNMTVTGTVTESPTILTSYVTIIAGTGSLTCANVQVGTNSPIVTLTNVLSTTLKLVATINNFHATGNVTVSTTSITLLGITIAKIDAAFSLQGGTTLIDGYILTQANPAGIPTFTVEPPTSTSAKLQLSALVPINTACLTGSVDFYNSTGTGIATIEYNNTTGTTASPQTVYSSSPTYLDASPSVYQNIKLTGNGVKKAQSSNVTIAGDWASSGGKVDMVSNNPTVIFQGTTQNLSDTTSDSGNGVLFKNVNFQASGTKLISLGNFAVSSTGILTMATTSSTILNANSLLTLKSDVSSTAAVAVIPTGCSITGVVHVQRFITGGGLSSNRGYRLLSSPVNQTSATSSLSNTFSLSYIRDHTFNGISYAGAFTGSTTGAAGGFNNTSYGPTVYLWDERKVNDNKTYTSGKNIGLIKLTTNTFPTANTVDLSDGTTSLAVPVGNGYELFFLGPSTRTDGSTATPPADAVLTAHGYLNQQNVTLNLWYTPTGGTSGKLSYTSGLTSGSGYNMVGNPYASTIDLSAVLAGNNSATGIDNIYLLSAKNSPNQTFIAYTPAGTSAPSAGYAVSGEGFIVHAKTTGCSLIFTESQKSPTTQLTGAALIMSTPKSDQLTVNGAGLSPAIFKTAASDISFASAQDALTGMYVKITKDTLTYNYCGIYFGSQWSANFQQGDAVDFGGNAPKVMMASFSADGVRSAVKHFPDYRTKYQLIKLYAAGKTDGMYTLSLEGIRNIDTVNYKIKLYDNYKKDSTDIGRYKSYAYNQTIADTASYGANRFVLGIAQLPGSKYKLASLTAQKANDGVLVSWHTLNEGNNYFYALQKQQANGTDYSPLYTLQSTGINNYNYTDKTPLTGNNTYRLKQVDLLGNITYSSLVTVNYNNAGSQNMFVLYPNPTAEKLTVNVTSSTNSAAALSYNLKIYDAAGSLIIQKTAASTCWSENVSQFKPGLYIVELKNAEGYSLGQAKFLKE